MAARRAAGLTDDDLAAVRTQLAEGRRPRVTVAGSQFGEATTGTVTRVGDPAVDGDDYLSVRVKVGGVTDELRFAPKELSFGRGRRAARTSGATPAATRATRSAADEPTKAPARRPAKRAASPTPSPSLAANPTPTPTPTPTPAPVRPAAAPAKRPARSGRKAAPVPTVSITIASSGAEWTVSARRGARVVVKGSAVSPGAVAAIAALLAEPAIDEAVGAVNDTARSEAEARAEQLRAELAEVEAVLVSHRRP